MARDLIYINSNNILTLADLTDETNDAIVTNATVTVTLVSSAGTVVGGQIWPLAMSHIGSGTYRTTLPYTLVLDKNRPYYANVTIDVPGGQRWFKSHEVTAVVDQ